VGRAAERVGLENLAGVERTGDITDAGAYATETYRELGRGFRIGGDSSEPADHVRDRAGADRIQQVTAQSPRQSLIPIQRHHRRLNARRPTPRDTAPLVNLGSQPRQKEVMPLTHHRDERPWHGPVFRNDPERLWCETVRVERTPTTVLY
jgi:hypothetical protein